MGLVGESLPRFHWCLLSTWLVECALDRTWVGDLRGRNPQEAAELEEPEGSGEHPAKADWWGGEL